MGKSSALVLLVMGSMIFGLVPLAALADSTHYVVQAGDYLVLVGQKFGVPWQSIARANELVSPFTIFPGQSLLIPSSPECDNNDPEGTVYIVQSGDTLSLIAGKFGVPWQQIAQMNCIQAPYVITPGQVLRIPAEEA